MSIDVFWWFCKVKDTDFSVVQSEFNQAVQGVPNLPIAEDYDAHSLLEGVLTGMDLSSSLYHEPLNSMGYRIVREEFPLSPESIVEMVMQSRVAPPAILLMGIGSERFLQLPGYLGNMLIHSSEIEQTIETVSRILDVEWKSYFERAKLVLDYRGFGDHAVEDVSDALFALLKALKKVKDEGAGLLAVTSWGSF